MFASGQTKPRNLFFFCFLSLRSYPLITPRDQGRQSNRDKGTYSPQSLGRGHPWRCPQSGGILAWNWKLLHFSGRNVVSTADNALKSFAYEVRLRLKRPPQASPPQRNFSLKTGGDRWRRQDLVSGGARRSRRREHRRERRQVGSGMGMGVPSPAD